MPKKIQAQKQTESHSRLWALADRLRRSPLRLSLEVLVQSARKEKIPATWQDLYAFSIRLGRGEPIVIPPYVTDFISAYITDKTPHSILDPCAGIGSLLLPIVEKNALPKAKGISPVQPAFEVARSMDVRSLVEWTNASPTEVLDALGTFDLIVSSPPLGLRSVTEKFQIGEDAIEVRDSETNILALKAATHLTTGGEAIFILPNSFFFSAQSASTRDALPRLGLHIRSIIALPASVFAPNTSIELNLVVISRQETDEVFVGQLTPDRDPTPLLKNLRKRTPGPALELGRLLQLKDYRGWRALAAAEEHQRLVDRSGLAPVPLAEIVEEVNLADRKNEGNPFVDHSNSVYLPLIGTSPAVTTLADFKIKPHNYAQLVLNPEKAYAEFLAAFFNSPLGRKTRDALPTGAFIPKINKKSLLDATVYLLPFAAQKPAVDVGREIAELQLQLDQLHRGLWNRPVDAEKV
jgi:hypothetical protein